MLLIIGAPAFFPSLNSVSSFPAVFFLTENLFCGRFLRTGYISSTMVYMLSLHIFSSFFSVKIHDYCKELKKKGVDMITVKRYFSLYRKDTRVYERFPGREYQLLPGKREGRKIEICILPRFPPRWLIHSPFPFFPFFFWFPLEDRRKEFPLEWFLFPRCPPISEITFSRAAPFTA